MSERNSDFFVYGRSVRWLSKYNDKVWFTGKIRRVIGDRALVCANPDSKVLVVSTFRLFATI